MAANEKYFPWHPVQLWLRDGIFAGFILNKIMVASWPQERRPFPPIALPEEKRLLKDVLHWLDTTKLNVSTEPLARLANLGDGEIYPELNDEQARNLWLVLSQYGTSSKGYDGLHEQLRDYLSSQPDIDSAIRNGMDAFWRSIGPALDPERKNILEDH